MNHTMITKTTDHGNEPSWSTLNNSMTINKGATAIATMVIIINNDNTNSISPPMDTGWYLQGYYR